MYPPRIELLIPNYGPPLPFHSTFSHTASSNNDTPFNTAVSASSSLASVGSDPVKCLECYVKWYIKRISTREATFTYALKMLNERVYEFSDIKTISDDEWKEMNVKTDIYKTLRREMKPFTHQLRLNGDECDVDEDNTSDGASPCETDDADIQIANSRFFNVIAPYRY